MIKKKVSEWIYPGNHSTQDCSIKWKGAGDVTEDKMPFDKRWEKIGKNDGKEGDNYTREPSQPPARKEKKEQTTLECISSHRLSFSLALSWEKINK